MITYGMELFSVVFINERQVDRLKEWREECEYPYLMKLQSGQVFKQINFLIADFNLESIGWKY